MANCYILSNNPLASQKYGSLVKVQKTDVMGIYTAARDAIHLGAVLINHPLSGSVKPNESPYRSLVLSTRQAEVDEKSLQLIEGAIAVLKKLGIKEREYPETVLDDFQVIDLDLLDSAMGALPAEYHT
ncbi:GrdX family protein [Ruminococcaceae bacterium OttesenSCG-928-I18]|nr:GrdX family protein [Ruminococcaceae bacterium OttesenSCG-928-I18]